MALQDKSARPLLNAMYAISNFYDQVSFCRTSEVCDRTIIDEYFCERAKVFSETYGPISDTLGQISGVSDFGRGAKELAKSCAS